MYFRDYLLIYLPVDGGAVSEECLLLLEPFGPDCLFLGGSHFQEQLPGFCGGTNAWTV